MNISGIRIQAGFYDYNTIKNTQIQEETVPNTIDEVAKDTRVAEVTERERDNKPDHGATRPFILLSLTKTFSGCISLSNDRPAS